MMDMSMTEEEIDEFLTQPLIARLATIGNDGGPTVYPMWFLYEKGEVIISTGYGSPKTRDIKGDPRVAVAIDIGGESAIKAVIIKGRAKLEEGDIKETVKELLLKYLGTEDDPMYQRLINIPRVLIRIKPEKTLSWDYAKMG